MRIIVAVASGEAQADRPSSRERREWASDVGCNRSGPCFFKNENPGQVAAAGRGSASDIRLGAIQLALKFKPTAQWESIEKLLRLRAAHIRRVCCLFKLASQASMQHRSREASNMESTAI
jgi:hypothetical protein